MSNTLAAASVENTTQNYLNLASSAKGVDDPTLAFNLNYMTDYGVGMPFIDLMKMSRAWVGVPEGSGWGPTFDAEANPNILDADGWPTVIPDGLRHFTTIWAWNGGPEAAEDRIGSYVATYEGTGTVSIVGGTIISQVDGKIIFEITDDKSLQLKIEETDPDGTGDYIRDLSIVREEHLDIFEAGAVFNPAWVELIADARELRVMNWMKANGHDRDSDAASWEDRPTLDDVTWTTDNGVPVETLVQLANETGTDPWFTIPHHWDAEYIREFATYVRDNLDPGLKAKFEWSNETWNWLFEQTHLLADLAEEEWGARDNFAMYTKKAVEMAKIIDHVFGEEADARLVKVLGGFTPNTWSTERILSGEFWAKYEPDIAEGAADYFDELSVASYFGSHTLRFDTMRDELLAQIADPSVDAQAWLAGKLMEEDYRGSIPQLLKQLSDQKAVAEEYGVSLSLYEGGQHVHHQFGIVDVGGALESFLKDFVRSEYMDDLYQVLWDGWSAIGDGAFMQFSATGAAGKFGSWGLYTSLDDSTPRAELLETLNVETANWWGDDRDASIFQHGVTRVGTQWRDIIGGTSAEDYLAGGAGDDILIGGAGDDGLNGGDGDDTIQLNGAIDDYEVAVESDGFRLTGPDGSDYLVNIEYLQFGDGTKISIGELGLTVNGQAGDDLLVGGQGNDIIRGAEGDDRIRGNDGDDKLLGGGGADNIKGGGGSDNIRGNSGVDDIKAGGGDDTVKGGGGSDLIYGGRGADRLVGGGGADTISGKAGDDTLKGNSGSDVFQFRATDHNDTILDFRQGQDKIEIQSGARTFEALTIEQDGHDVLIGFGPGQVKIVTDNARAFDESDFIF